MEKIINKHATYDYEVLETYEAGLILFGHEAKAIKNQQLNFKGSYITVQYDPKPALFLVKAHLSLYKKAGNIPSYDPERPRKLLLHKKEIGSILGKLEQKGLTIIPLSVYTKRNNIKLEFCLARGKKKFEKKEAKKKEDVMREIRRTLKYQ
ncbi:MAG: SsrA-binding protein [Parcubacteria group bacterium GW2011_GWC2_39_14]|nr:MAG: SsrA-binding protein [Parcubacteria group bacterium GW2011_GWC2_39_14]KKR54957.1 MAG: SsrA-binding protein [Parcubacteria group bacterium GW2011_GWA2_40_23]